MFKYSYPLKSQVISNNFLWRFCLTLSLTHLWSPIEFHLDLQKSPPSGLLIEFFFFLKESRKEQKKPQQQPNSTTFGKEV